MGKAYTQEEKEEIKKRIWEAGLELFHADEETGLNIREITARAGISLGCFYRFYPDKQSLLTDIMEYRAGQKLDRLKLRFPESEEEPAVFLSGIILEHFLDMEGKIEKKSIYREAFRSLRLWQEERREQDMLNVYVAFLEELNSYWEKHGVPWKAEPKGIIYLVIGLMGYGAAKRDMEKRYYEELLKVFIDAGVNKYLMPI